MASFGRNSRERLDHAHPDLRILFNAVVQDFDCVILESVRSREQQAENVRKGVSKTMESKHLADHNGQAWAVDAAPYPLEWPLLPVDDSPAELKRWMKDCARFYYFGGYVMGVAKQLNLRIRWGADWDGDRNIHEQSFDDLPHFEVLP